jgi:hypothetical protein
MSMDEQRRTQEVLQLECIDERTMLDRMSDDEGR